jgi:CheY-like chemotaxis protein
MGLAMVHGIVHEHRGHLVVDSRPGVGTTFRVLLPALASSEAASAPRAASAALEAFPRERLTGRVAVVDDEASVLAFMRDLLDQWGVSASAFGDPREALAAIDAGAPFDLLLTDQTMQGMTGLELGSEARLRRPNLPIVLYTGYREQFSGAQAQAAGVAAILRKPVEPSVLFAVLREQLGAAR